MPPVRVIIWTIVGCIALWLVCRSGMDVRAWWG